MKLGLFLLRGGLVVACTGVIAHAQVRYQMTDLGLVTSPNYQPARVNAAGVVVGSVLSPGLGSAFTLEAGVVRRLGPAPGGTGSAGYDINDAGWVVGISLGHPAVPPNSQTGWAMIDRGSGPELLPQLPGATESLALAINEHGQIVGRSMNQPVIWDGGTVRTLPTPFPQGGLARAISDSGIVAGSSRSGAALWIDGQFIALPGIGGGGLASAVNDAGVSVGWASTSTSRSVACLWRDGVLIELAPRSWTSRAVDINNDGLIIGSVIGEETFAFLSDGADRWDLNDLVDPPPGAGGADILFASNIDDSGRILCEAYVGGELRCVLLTPVPAPAAAGPVVLWLVALGRRRARPSEPRP